MNAEGVSVVGSLSDAEVLAQNGLLREGRDGILQTFSVLPRDVEYYQEINRRERRPSIPLRRQFNGSSRHLSLDGITLWLLRQVDAASWSPTD
jgi:hypothetical protein